MYNIFNTDRGEKKGSMKDETLDSNTKLPQETTQVLKELDTIIDQAEELISSHNVKDPELMRANKVVEEFLRKRKRICYGGMAINAHLPKNKKIYDFSKELADYDFYTPALNTDMKEIETMLKDAGFTNVYSRLGMNPGTTKINVNYAPVADLTYRPEWLCKSLTKKALVKQGIYYADADLLRSNMYLELSRPRGSVDRWQKVYQRLLLLSEAKPVDLRDCKPIDIMAIPNDVHTDLLKYIIKKKYVFLGAEVETIYRNPNSFPTKSLDESTHPVLILSPSPEKDVKEVKKRIQKFYKGHNDTTLRIVNLDTEGSYLPNISGIMHGETIVFIAIQEQVCHSYNAVPYDSGKLFIASLDACINIFYTLSYIHGFDGILPYTVGCFSKQLVKISQETRDKNKPGIYPLISIDCSGYQPGIRSLLRHKVDRVKAYKLAEQKRKTFKHTVPNKMQNNTINNNTIRNNTTRKNKTGNALWDNII